MVKNFIVKTSLVLLSVGLTLGAFDLAVYLWPRDMMPAPLLSLVRQMEINAGSYYRRDPELGFTIKPGTDFIFPGEEFTFRLETRLNFPDAGFRGGTAGGPAWGAAFGDSFTFGAGVNQADTWVARLSELTNREILNFGVPGHGPYQHTRILRKYGAPLGPKFVFYGLFTNDLEDGARYERRSPNRVARLSMKQFMKEYSASYNLIRNFLRSLKRRREIQEWDDLGLKLLDRKLRNPYSVPDEQFASAWERVAQQVDDAYEESQRINATFVLLYFPSKEEVYWKLAEEKVKEIASVQSFEERMDRLRKTVNRFCASRRFPCLDLSPELKKRGLRGEKLYFPVDIHWNEKGNLVVAQEIYKFLLKQKLI